MKALFLAIISSVLLTACVGMDGGLFTPPGTTSPEGELSDDGSFEGGPDSIEPSGVGGAAEPARIPLGDATNPRPDLPDFVFREKPEEAPKKIEGAEEVIEPDPNEPVKLCRQQIGDLEIEIPCSELDKAIKALD